MDGQNENIILSHKGKKSREVASLTQIMTCYVVAKRIALGKLKKDERVQVSKIASSMIGTSAFLRTGDILGIEDLLHAMMLPSGNDAAYALAEYVGKTIYFESEEYQNCLLENPLAFDNCKSKDAVRSFIQEMNQVAQDLGMTNTHFSNPHGLANQFNQSCSLDICQLCTQAMKNQLFRSIVQRQIYSCVISNSKFILEAQQQPLVTLREVRWENTNKCLNKNGCQGIKTGITNPAGPCMACSFKRGDRQIIVVVLQTQNEESRFTETWEIFEWICDQLGICEKRSVSDVITNNQTDQENSTNQLE